MLDRFWWSTWVYGMVAKANRKALRAMIRAERACWNRTHPSATFLITRAKSLREQEVAGRWRELCQAYQELAESERRRYPVYVISNDSTVEDALCRMVSSVEAD